MVHWYSVVYSFYKDGKRIHIDGYKTLSDEEPEDKEIEVTWSNVSEIYVKYGWSFPGSIWDMKKGRVFSFWNPGCVFSFEKDYQKDIKEWKEELHMTLEITHKIQDDIMSINDVLNYRNSDMAIRYLTERGLNISES